MGITKRTSIKYRKEIFMFSKLTLLGKSLFTCTLIAYVVGFLPLGISNVTIKTLLLFNIVIFNGVILISSLFNKSEWESFCLKLSYLGLTVGLLIIRSFVYTWDDLCFALVIMTIFPFISIIATYCMNSYIREKVNKKLIKDYKGDFE